MVEELRQGVTDLVEPGPIQITQDDPLFGFLLRGFNRPNGEFQHEDSTTSAIR